MEAEGREMSCLTTKHPTCPAVAAQRSRRAVDAADWSSRTAEAAEMSLRVVNAVEMSVRAAAAWENVSRAGEDSHRRMRAMLDDLMGRISDWMKQ